MTRLAVLASGAGSITAAVLDAAADGRLDAEIVAVLSDRRDAGVLDVAAARAVPSFVVDPAEHADRRAWDATVADTLRSVAPDWVASLGFMRLLGAGVLEVFPDRVLNTHPALLPAFPGRHAVRDALAYGVTLTGCTVHLVDAGVDTGPVLAQEAVPVAADDDEETLHERIRAVERRLVVDVLTAVVAGGVEVDPAHPRRPRVPRLARDYAQRA